MRQYVEPLALRCFLLSALRPIFTGGITDGDQVSVNVTGVDQLLRSAVPNKMASTQRGGVISGTVLSPRIRLSRQDQELRIDVGLQSARSLASAYPSLNGFIDARD